MERQSYDKKTVDQQNMVSVWVPQSVEDFLKTTCEADTSVLQTILSRQVYDTIYELIQNPIRQKLTFDEIVFAFLEFANTMNYIISKDQILLLNDFSRLFNSCIEAQIGGSNE